MKEKLKPCPFCGSKVKLELWEASQWASGLESWYICCPKARTNELLCVGSLSVHVLIGGVFNLTKEQAREKILQLWNTRSEK